VLVTLPDGVVIDATVVLGVLGTVLAFALYVCTAMIYACLPFLREWNSPLTVANYILLGGASGFTLAAVFALSYAPELTRFYAGWALIITLLGWISRSASLLRNSRLRPKSTVQTAIGIKHPRIVQKSAGFLGGSFNTREFFHGKTAATLSAVKWVFLVAAFALPLLLLAVGLWSDQPLALPLAFAVQYIGLLFERWFFFAQAKHPQNFYYQAIS
jgi:DMSO reductase anchor subunit